MVGFIINNYMQQAPIALLPPDLKEKDWILGAGNVDRIILQPDGQWDNFLPDPETQRKAYDPYGCVSFSALNCLETLSRRLYNEKLNKSDRYLTVKSGTKPGVGNSVSTVADTLLAAGVCNEEEYPFTDLMLEDEFYQKIPSEVDELAAKLLPIYQINHEWVPLAGFQKSYSSSAQLIEALKYSPLQVSVDGRYELQDDGLIGRLLGYTHEVMLYGYVKDTDGSIAYWKIFDTYNPFTKKFIPDYKFGYPKSWFLKKKTNMKIYKQIGFPAIYALNEEDGVLVPFSDGVITGGKLFKTLYGVESYKDLPRVKDNGQDWATLPYPVASYSFITK